MKNKPIVFLIFLAYTYLFLGLFYRENSIIYFCNFVVGLFLICLNLVTLCGLCFYFSKGIYDMPELRNLLQKRKQEVESINYTDFLKSYQNWLGILYIVSNFLTLGGSFMVLPVLIHILSSFAMTVVIKKIVKNI